MNKPVIDRSILRRHVAAIEAAYPIRILGLLPRGSADPEFENLITAALTRALDVLR